MNAELGLTVKGGGGRKSGRGTEGKGGEGKAVEEVKESKGRGTEVRRGKEKW